MIEDAQTAFMVVVKRDGTIDTHTKDFPSLNLDRYATLFDIEMYSRQLSHNASRTVLAHTLMSLLTSEEPEPSDLVAQALAKRQKED